MSQNPSAVDDLRDAFRTRFGREAEPPARLVERFDKHGSGDADALLEEVAGEARVVFWALLDRDPDQQSMASLVLLGDPSAMARSIERSAEYRTLLGQRLQKLAPAPPARRLILDHIPKTGGTAIERALRILFPHAVVSPRWDPVTGDSPAPGDLARWPVVTGHIGRGNHNTVSDDTTRIKATIIRSPEARIRSIYRYWRNDIRESHPAFNLPEVQAARHLRFTDFIRSAAAQPHLVEQQATFLTGKMPHRLSGALCVEMLGYWDLVGTTDDLPTFLVDLLAKLDVAVPTEVGLLLPEETRNKSSGPEIDISPADHEYLRSMNPLEWLIYSTVKTKAVRRFESTTAP